MSNKAGITLRLNQVENEDERNSLQMEFLRYETAKREEVTAIREARRAMAHATKAAAEAELSQLEFLIKAGNASELDAITTEPDWNIRRTASGEVVMECLMTQNDIQKVVRAQTQMVKDQSAQILKQTGGDVDDDAMFGGAAKE